MTVESIIIAIATLLSPIIAVWISETFIRKQNLVDNQKREVLYDLIANRYKLNTPEFLRAINSVVMLWGDEDKIKKLIFKFRTASVPEKSPALVEIIYQLCKMEKIKSLSREGILNIFE